MTPRQTAFEALLASYREQRFIDQSLATSQLSGRDRALAQEIACGTMRMTLALDHLAKQLTAHGKLNVKLKEKVLLRMAVYQFYYMDTIPLYAITNETLEIAKKECNKRSLPFLNAALRNLEKANLSLPKDLSICHSFPPYFVEELTRDYGDAQPILQALNKPPHLVARKIGSIEFVPVESLSEIVSSPDLYIQNPTPANLMHELLADCRPATILDLCAAPGGKSLLAHELFPKAELVVNDIAESKREILEENFAKYGIDAEINHFPGQEYPTDRKFDLVIVDAPCSNSGVLHKRPEARWRLSPENTRQLLELQNQILSHALTLLNPGGAVVYLTCSILKSENEGTVEKQKARCSMQRTFLPDTTYDGGFGALLIP